MSDNDVIKMTTNINVTDSNGNPIPVVTPRPEVLLETFSFNGETRSSSEIITGDE